MRKALVATLAAVLVAGALHAQEKPILVVYDFTSTGDDGKLGAWVAQIVRGHAIRSGRYVGNPKITVDEVLAERDFKPTVETPPAALAKFTRDAFDANIFVYGSAVRRGEDDFEVLFRVYRATKKGAEEKICEEKRRCPGKRYVPLAVDEILNTAAGMKDPPTEWRLLAGELATWSKELAARAADTKLGATDWRQQVLSWQDKFDYRYRNVTARTHVDYASKALLDYYEEVSYYHVQLVKELTGGDLAKARARARHLAALADCLSRSVVHWLDEEAAEERWKTAKNLVMNGGFEYGQKTPANWEPLKEHMSWVTDPDGKSGKVVKFDMPQGIAGTYGMLLYSQPFKVEPGATYRLRWRFKTMAPAVKLFIKGYDAFPGQAGFDAQDREVWRSRKDPQYGARVVQDYNKKEWTTYGHDFVPYVRFPRKRGQGFGTYAKVAKQPRYLKLMLYAYWPKGVVYWDDIVVKKLKDAPERPK